MKILKTEIYSCYQCPAGRDYLFERACTKVKSKGGNNKRISHLKLGKISNDNHVFPDWCPLEDSEPTKAGPD